MKAEVIEKKQINTHQIGLSNNLEIIHKIYISKGVNTNAIHLQN